MKNIITKITVAITSQVMWAISAWTPSWKSNPYSGKNSAKAAEAMMALSAAFKNAKIA